MLKIHEVLFILAGLLILFSLPWISGPGFYTWTLGKVAYFTGIFFFIIDTYKQIRHPKQNV